MFCEEIARNNRKFDLSKNLLMMTDKKLIADSS